MIKRWLKKVLVKIYLLQQKLAVDELYRSYRAKYEIDPSFRFNGPDITLYGEGRIVIGSDSYIGSYSTLQSATNAKIEIGNKCRISHNVRIYTTTNFADQNFTSEKIKKFTNDVSIGHGVWIGVNVFISPGITIGNNSVIGANSVVTGNVPENAIVGGIPAKLIRMKKDLNA